MADDRTRLALISNSLPPYRLRLHERLAAQLSEVTLYSVFTHEAHKGLWDYSPPDAINPVLFGAGEDPSGQSSPRRALHEWRKGGRIIRWMRETGIQAVVMNGYNDPARLRIALWCRRRGVPCFVRGDSNIKLERESGGKARLKQILLPRLLRIFFGAMAVGTNGVAFFRHYGVPDEKIFLVPFEPGYDRIERMTASQVDALRDEMGWSKQRRRIVFTGRLVALKRVDLIIDAFLSLASQRPDWDLVIIGDGPERESLEAKVPAEMRGRVFWTGFLTDQDQISKIHGASDVLVMASNRERWALVVNEAAAAGLAIVSSDIVGAAADLVRDGDNGRIFPADDLGALTEALRDVTDEQHIDRMKADSRSLLNEWRERHPPEAGLREALRTVGLLS